MKLGSKLDKFPDWRIEYTFWISMEVKAYFLADCYKLSSIFTEQIPLINIPTWKLCIGQSDKFALIMM